MSQLDLSKMQEIQKELQEKYFEKWGGLSPEKGKVKLLQMMIEARGSGKGVFGKA